MFDDASSNQALATMIKYLLKRIVQIVPVAFGVSLICFLLIQIAPGDPLSSVMPTDATLAQQLELRRAYGFDQPLVIQYGRWLLNVLKGDLGHSISTGQPVLLDVGRALLNTLALSILATIIGFSFGSFFGFVAGFFRDSWLDKVASIAAVLGVSVPHYWLGIILVIIFSVHLGWLPPGGSSPGNIVTSFWHWEQLRYMILPAITMSVIPMGIIARTVRALVVEICAQDFVTALYAKGLLERGVLLHIVKNAAPTAIAVMGLQLGYLRGGSILVETVFSWPGAGFLLGNAIFQRDLPLLQGSILVLAMLFVVLNLIVDILQSLLDPRIRRS
jgi:peptide/nickel transport system permease protein